MGRRMGGALAALVAVTVGLFPSVAAAEEGDAGAGPIRTVDLTEPGVAFSPRQINERGQVLGTAPAEDPSRTAVLLYDRGRLTEVSPPPPGPNYAPYYNMALNDRGDAAGTLVQWPYLSPQTWTPFLWTQRGPIELGLERRLIFDLNNRRQLLVSGGAWQDGRLVETPPAEGIDGASFTRLDDRGTAAGYVIRSDGTYEAATWRVGAPITPLGTFGLNLTEAIATTGDGAVVAAGYTPVGARRAVVWRRGRAVDIGTLGGSSTNVTAVSDRGHVVGGSLTASGEQHAFYWRNGEMVDLGPIGADDDDLGPPAVNRWGQVLVQTVEPDGTRRGFLWQDGRRLDLGALVGSDDTTVTDINDRGQIIGTRLDPATGQHRAVMWTVPPWWARGPG